MPKRNYHLVYGWTLDKRRGFTTYSTGPLKNLIVSSLIFPIHLSRREAFFPGEASDDELADTQQHHRLVDMCIHHLKKHLACGHTTQSQQQILHCYPVARALTFYHDQPRLLLERREGRALTADPMKAPQRCGASLVTHFRPVTLVGAVPSIKPVGWLPDMTFRTRELLENGEDIRSTAVIIETEWPQLQDKVSEQWIHYLRQCFHCHGLQWYRHEDLPNENLAGDIITETVEMGCGHYFGDEKCFVGWVNPFGGGPAYCPVFRKQDTGIPIPKRPEYVPAELLPGPDSSRRQLEDEDTWEARHMRELFYQSIQEQEKLVVGQRAHHIRASPPTPQDSRLSATQISDLTARMKAVAFKLTAQQSPDGKLNGIAPAPSRPATTKAIVRSLRKTKAEAQSAETTEGDCTVTSIRVPRTTSEPCLKVLGVVDGKRAKSVGPTETCRDEECDMCDGNEDQLRAE